MSSESETRGERLAALERLRQLIGIERPVDEVSREIWSAALRLGAAEVGAIHVACSDESELECEQAFQTEVVQRLLPRMKSAHQAPFRLFNPGARYERGSVAIAEGHFATPATAGGFKLLLVKVNAHVAADWTGASAVLGRLNRYGRDSACCGALAALLAGGRAPFLDDLREVLESDGKDRLAALLDPARVDPRRRAFCAALVSARMQARRAVLDIQSHRPKSPTLYIVLPCVTINRESRDGEILCGLYTADHRGDELAVEYVGLGDDPSAYEVRRELERYAVEDPGTSPPGTAP
ncbi:MAG: hypothetical protein JXA90_07230 [Planctomycetes bacterium]|nr:hypothetical protein [Planctomycetota bacterium]